MLTLPEKILFLAAVVLSLYGAFLVAQRISGSIQRGEGRLDWSLAKSRLGSVLVKTITLRSVYRLRLWPSLFHGFIAWGFIYFLLVNLFDVLTGFIPGFQIPGIPGNLYRLGADVLSVGVLVGMSALVIRRFLLKPDSLTTRQDILLHPKAQVGIRRDSAIVSAFILLHVGARFLGESFKIAAEGTDPWQPFASALATLWSGWSEAALIIAMHITFWLALGAIVGFLAYL